MKIIIEEFQVIPITQGGNSASENRAAFVSFICNGFWLSGIRIDICHGAFEIKYPTQKVCGVKAPVFTPVKNSIQDALKKEIANKYKAYCERTNDDLLEALI